MVPAKDRKSTGVFVNIPFIKFHKMDEKDKAHQKTQYHEKAMIASTEYKESVEMPVRNVDCLIQRQILENIVRNHHIIARVAEAILFCRCQCIALHGDKETPSSEPVDGNLKYSGNLSNFLAALQMIVKRDDILRNHLLGLGLTNDNAKYTSVTIQNEIIDIIAKE